MTYELRYYRDWVKKDGLVDFEVKDHETDLAVRAEKDLARETLKLVRRFRADIELYADAHPGFLEALTPTPEDAAAPDIVQAMIQAALVYGVGPMASVAGALAEFVGTELLRRTSQVVVENGGDVFLKMNRPVRLLLYSGETSPFGGKLLLKLDAPGEALGACTSSAHVGPSLSYGHADAVMAIAESAALADAAATAIGNRVKSPEDVTGALEQEQSRGLLRGVVITIGDTLGAFGEIELEEL